MRPTLSTRPSRRSRIAAICLSVLGVTVFSARAAARFERALAAEVNETGRDAVVFRLPEGRGVGMFLPEAPGGFSLRLLPALGPGIRSVTLGDGNGDGRVDLTVAREDGAMFLWRGDGRGDFSAELQAAPVVDHAGHAGMHHPTEAEPPRLAGEERASVLRRLASAPTTDGGETDLGAVLAGLTLPHGFTPRLATTGRFSDDGGEAVAIVSEGPRPRLVLVSTDGAGRAVRELAIPEATFTVNVGQGGFVFAPSSVTIAPNDTVHWVWVGPGHTVTSGSGCVANNLFCSPSNASCATAPTSSTGATYDRMFPSLGNFPYFCRPHCTFGMTGNVNVAAPASPGTVPDGSDVPGVPLRLAKGAGSSLLLTWGVSCSASVTGYGIYEGSIPIAGAYDHEGKECALGNVTNANIAPGAGDRYYLVVAQTATAEGSYGRNSTGSDIPQGTGACRATQTAAPCP